MDSTEEATTITKFITRQRTATAPRPTFTSSTSATESASVNIASQKTTVPTTFREAGAPSQALVNFWAFILVVLLLILLGYIGFTIYIFVVAIPKGREQKRQKAIRAAQAARQSVALGLPTDAKPAPRIIDTSTRSKRHHNFSRKADRLGHVGESYEMEDLHSRKTSASPHVRWGGEHGRSSSVDRSRKPSPEREAVEAQIWSGLNARNINDVDENTRILALQKMRETQRPSQTNFGDDNVWSPVTTTEDLRQMFKDRRRQ